MAAVDESTAGLAEAVDQIGALAERDDLTLADLVVAREALELVKAAVPLAMAKLDRRIAQLVNPLLASGNPAKSRHEYVPVVDHAGEQVTADVRAGWKAKYGDWDDEGLLRTVLDSRLIDPRTGEPVDETQADKLLHVWPHAARDARKGALERRGVDIDDFRAKDYVADVTIRR